MVIAHFPPTAVPIEEISELNPGWKVEREADGSITMSPTVTLSGLHDSALMEILLGWRAHAGGKVFGSSTGFTMPDKALLSPDASWLRADRWDAIRSIAANEYVQIVPDVCIEIASKTDDYGYLVAKLQRYRRYGAAYVLLIDPYQRRTWSDGEAPAGFPTDFTSVFDADR